MPTYRVCWEIDIDAETPADSAKKAWEIMRAPKSTANVFSVSVNKHSVEIDLQEMEREMKTQ